MSDLLGLTIMVIAPLFFGIYASRKMTQIGDHMFVAKEKSKDDKKDESDKTEDEPKKKSNQP